MRKILLLLICFVACLLIDPSQSSAVIVLFPGDLDYPVPVTSGSPVEFWDPLLSPGDRNHSWETIIVPDGSIIDGGNFSQLNPFTSAILGENLIIRNANLVNVFIRESWSIDGLNTAQIHNIQFEDPYRIVLGRFLEDHDGRGFEAREAYFQPLPDVPEPSTMLLLGAGLLGGVRLRRRSISA